METNGVILYYRDKDTGEQLPINAFEGSIPVILQDQFSEIISLYMCQNKGTTTLTTSYVINTKIVVVASATGASVGDAIEISENGRLFQSIITNIATNTITMASPTDQAFTTGAVVTFGEWDFAQANGSVTPVVYKIKPPVGVKWDITKLNFSFTDDTTMDDGKFGGITALTSGLIFRAVDGYTKQMGIISNNAGFREYGFECQYSDKAPAGLYGYNGNLKIKDTGVVMRLNGDTGDEFQIIVNDNLTGLTKLAFVCQGHTVE